MRQEKYYCPICGAYAGCRRHTCSQRVLNAIDASYRRNPDEEEPKAVPFSQRLRLGFQMLNESQDEEDQYAVRSLWD